MRGTSVRAGRAALAALLVLGVGLLGSCDGGGTTPPDDDGDDDPTTGSLLTTVTTDGSAEPGVTVDLFDSGGSTSLETMTTDGSGEATFTQLDPAAYDVEVTVPAGQAVSGGGSNRKSATVTAGQQAAVSFALEDTTTSSTGGDTLEIHLTGSFTFEPANPTITEGTVVRWINDTNSSHTVTPDGHNEWSRQTTSTQEVVFEHTFLTAGSFPYFCEPHQGIGMVGSITVEQQ